MKRETTRLRENLSSCTLKIAAFAHPKTVKVYCVYRWCIPW